MIEAMTFTVRPVKPHRRVKGWAERAMAILKTHGFGVELRDDDDTVLEPREPVLKDWADDGPPVAYSTPPVATEPPGDFATSEKLLPPSPEGGAS